jgi:hypothetical protein
MKSANALMLLAGQASPDKTRQGAHVLLAREQRGNSLHDCKRKSPEKTAEDQLLRQDKKFNDILSFMGQLAKDKNSKASPSYPATGNHRSGGRDRGHGRGGFRGPHNNRTGRDDPGQKENVKQQASRAATQSSKRGRKSGKESGSDHDDLDSEYPEYAYSARTKGMWSRLGTRVKIDEDEEVEGMNLYGKTSGDLDQDEEQHRIERALSHGRWLARL